MATKTTYVHYSLDRMFERRMINHERRLASRARVRAAQGK